MCNFMGKEKGDIPESLKSLKPTFQSRGAGALPGVCQEFSALTNNLLSPACLLRQVGITWAAVSSSTASLPEAGPRDAKRLPKQSKYKTAAEGR